MQVRRVLLHAVHTDHTRARICSACAWRECRADRASGKGTRRRVAHVTSCRPSTHNLCRLPRRNSTDTAYFQRLRPYPRVLLRRCNTQFKDYDKCPIGCELWLGAKALWGLRCESAVAAGAATPSCFCCSTRGNWTVQLIQPLLSHDSTDNLSLRSGAFCMTGSWRGGVLHRDGGTPRLPAAV